MCPPFKQGKTSSSLYRAQFDSRNQPQDSPLSTEMAKRITGNQQEARFEKVFDAYLKGTRPVANRHNSELFLEAAQKYPTPSVCIEKIIASPSGLRSVRHSVRASDDKEFILSRVFPFLSYLSDPDVGAMSEGKLLQQMILAIVVPPTAWFSILQLYIEDGFTAEPNYAQTFAWLCLQIVISGSNEIIALSEDISPALQKQPLLNHPSPKVREYGYQIQKVLEIRLSVNTESAIGTDTDTPGGRHDNDFANFRQISVYPTRDELASTLRPFYRRAIEVASTDPLRRTSEHLDNQYRLLREDMLAELREDIQVAMGKKPSRRRCQRLGRLGLLDLNTGDEKRGQLCTLLITVGYGLEVIHNKNPSQRKFFLKEHPNILRHRAFGALCSGDEILGFAFVHRDIDRLAESPPVVGLQFTSSEVLVKVLDAFRTPQCLCFVLVDTPVFAYEPVLERLKDITELPLEKQILRLSGQQDEDNFIPAEHLSNFLEKYGQRQSGGSKIRIGSQMYTLDAAQLDALVYAIRTPLSTIQGPPGKSH